MQSFQELLAKLSDKTASAFERWEAFKQIKALGSDGDNTSPIAPTDTPTTPNSPIFDRGTTIQPTTKTTRQKANDMAIALLTQIQTDGLTRDDLTSEQLETLAKYTGNGGGIKNKAGETGSQYEYYTQKELATGVWDFAKALGFNGGKVLDPSAGTGIFAATSPNSAVMDNIELDNTSGGIAKVLNDGERSTTTIAPFEKESQRIEDNSLDMVITNVPFGKNSDRGANKNLDKAYQDESLENYFILRSLEKLKSGGLAVFIVPKSVVSGKQADQNRLRLKASLKAEFLGAYRLPNSVFAQTGADVITDVIAFRKFDSDTLEKVQSLYEEGNVTTLSDSKVLWNDFLSGDYFRGDGKRFILGEVVQEKDRWQKMSDKVVTTKTTPEIAKMLQKFGNSRIDWELLGATETQVITYSNGDTLFKDGKQLSYQDGIWQEIAKEDNSLDRDMQNLLTKLDNGYTATVAGVTWEQIQALQSYCNDTNQRGLIPDSILDIIKKAQQSNNPAVAWKCISTAKAIGIAIAENGYGYDYVKNEAILTKALKSAFLDGKNSQLTGDGKQAHKLISLHYNKGDYSSVWVGDVDNSIDDNEPVAYQDKIAQMQYQNKSLFITREQFNSVHADIDPLKNDDWFIKANGDVVHANDFLVGKLADRLADIDKEIAQATDDDVKAKLIKQKMLARDAVVKIDVRNVNYNLRSPLIDAETKVRFLQGQKDIGTAAKVVIDEFGRAIADIEYTGSNKKDTEKLLNRMGDWLAKGTVTLGGIGLSMNEGEALAWLSERINTANIEFETWLKANDKLMADLDARINSDKNMFFSQYNDESPVEIAGMNPELKLHGYQNAFVRNQGRSFGGINGFGVGLGKTFSALASVQHVQNIGVKRKTIFVVPNSVLSNWRKEAKNAYADMDDCIFIGLRENGDKFKVSPNLYDEDLTQAIDRKYRKIFMTYEAFKRIRLKDDTLESYAHYLKTSDKGYEIGQKKKENEKKRGNLSNEIEKVTRETNAPYIEDMGIDSIVIDEAHAFKNSITAPETENGIKYLSIPGTSARGDDAQAKCWYVRDLTVDKDGVQLLTATPITNSPLEIYSMLCLGVGREKVNSMCGGVNGADDFLKVMCSVFEEVVPTIDGRTRSQNVFKGIQNGIILNKAVTSVALVKDAKDVGLSVVIPNREETATKIGLNKDTMSELITMQKAYQVARLFSKEKGDEAQVLMSEDPSMRDAYEAMKEKFGESDDLLGHPFNLIRKMDIMIADEEFSSLATFYDFDPKQKAIAQKAVEQFNNKKTKEQRTKLSQFTNPDDITEITKKEGNEVILVGYKVLVKAKIIINGGRERIMIDTMDSLIQQNFENIADSLKLKLNVTASAKVTAMIENFKHEMASPRGVKADGLNSKQVKQIIFCDHLFLHNKIKRLLVEKAGMKADKIVVITGQVNNEPDAIIDIQDGFNAFDEDNKYQVIIANKKAEVGINLQRGTQAIHHLTTGWTPDSLEQRNGRGARQGNLTSSVRIYHYDADGTFDEFKRTMINKKDEWISNVLSGEGKNKIAVSGGISQSEQDALIRTMGNAKAIADYQDQKDELDKQERLATANKQQSININIIKNQFEVLQNANANDGYIADIKNVVLIIRDNITNKKNANDAKRALNTRENYAKKYASNRDNALKIIQKIIDNISYKKSFWNPIKQKLDYGEAIKITMTADEIYNTIERNAKEFSPSKMDNNWSGWESKFQYKIIKHSNLAIIIDETSEYQAEHDEKTNTAKNLIRVAKKAVNEVAAEYGGTTLPDDADQKMIEGKAKIEGGKYIEVGALVLDTAKNQYVVVNDKLSGTYVQLDSARFWEGRLPLYNKDQQVILPNSSDYLAGVKVLASYEDQLFAKGMLKAGEIGGFSKIIPMVAEYRDKSVVAFYEVKDRLFGTSHNKLVNANFPFVVPFKMLSSTEFGRNIMKAYRELDLDFDDSCFSVNHDSNIVVEGNAIRTDKEILDALAEFIISRQITITKNDVLLNDIRIYRRLTNQPEQFLVTVRDELKTLPDDYTSDDITALSKKLYNDYIKLNRVSIIDISDKDKDSLLYMAATLGNPDPNPDNFVFWNYLEKTAKLYKAHQAVAGNTTTNDTDFHGIDTIAITGNTQKWKEEIKDYAFKYGVSINRSSRKFLWDGRNAQWLVSYQAYTKLVQDYPSAGNDLQIKKVS